MRVLLKASHSATFTRMWWRLTGIQGRLFLTETTGVVGIHTEESIQHWNRVISYHLLTCLYPRNSSCTRLTDPPRHMGLQPQPPALAISTRHPALAHRRPTAAVYSNRHDSNSRNSCLGGGVTEEKVFFFWKPTTSRTCTPRLSSGCKCRTWTFCSGSWFSFKLLNMFNIPHMHLDRNDNTALSTRLEHNRQDVQRVNEYICCLGETYFPLLVFCFFFFVLWAFSKCIIIPHREQFENDLLGNVVNFGEKIGTKG